MLIVDSEGKYSKEGMIIDEPLKESIKRKFTKKEALVLVATYNSVIITENINK